MHQHFQPVFTHPSRGGGAPSQPNMGKPGMESKSWAADLQMFFWSHFFQNTDTFNRGIPGGGQKSGKYHVLEVFFLQINLKPGFVMFCILFGLEPISVCSNWSLGQKSCSNASKRYQQGVLMWGPGKRCKNWRQLYRAKRWGCGNAIMILYHSSFLLLSQPLLPKFVQLVILG